MDEPYFTIVKWWAKLLNGPFFATVTDRGKSGFRVQFHDDWIDWRILSTRGTKMTNRFELPEMAIEEQMDALEHELRMIPLKLMLGGFIIFVIGMTIYMMF